MIVEVGSGTVGWLVSEYCAPVTDKIVDKASDYIVIKRGERKSKKTSEEK
jgi:hypothetical protein